VSWPLISFLLVGLVLAVGWLAYERARPSARMVAVVATLAAVAALGRDAFVALPDVKPITAMTLAVGYALGPLPGFTVGALGMLASNVLLGQGPYTPWQMAAWGLVGLAGAALGRLSGRRLGRVGLALACALAALAAKEVMNLYTWTLGASHTPGAFVLIAGTALPFDVTDVAASFLFGLAFAPELARLLARVRARMHVDWELDEHAPNTGRPPPQPGGRSLPAAAGSASAILALAVMAVLAGAQLGGPETSRAVADRAAQTARQPAARAVSVGRLSSLAATRAGPNASQARASLGREVSFLASAQNADGGFGAARGQGSSELYTAWAAMAVAATGLNPAGLHRGGHSVLDSLRAQAYTLQGVGDAERTILAARACRTSAYSFAGRDLVSEMMRARARDHSFAELVNLTAFGIFAMRAIGHTPSFRPIRDAAGWIERQQGRDGGFGFAAGGGSSDVDDTAAALQALVDAGARNGRALGAAESFLVRSQNPDGGYPQQYGGESNAQSTAWAVQGLIAAGRDPASVRRRGSRSPLGYLESLLTSNGSIRYSRTSAQTPVWVTAQALIALAGWTFPVG
jgi:energy-coupling factor transport system substrate-specific component